MITSTSLPEKYLTRFTDGAYEALADTTPEHGGRSGGFRPHALLEAALANCLCMVVRIAADKRGIPLGGVRVRVDLKREGTGETGESVFTYAIELDGDLSEAQRATLLRAAQGCPIKKTLSQKVVFRPAGG